MGQEGAEGAALICGVVRPPCAPDSAGGGTPTPPTQAPQALARDMHTTAHRNGAHWGTGGTELVLTGGLGGASLGWGGKGFACAKEIPWAALLRDAAPHGQSKEGRGPSAPASPSPGTWWGALGEPTVAARQGRQDMGRGLLPAAPDPGDAAASQGGDPVQGPWGLHPPSQQPQ